MCRCRNRRGEGFSNFAHFWIFSCTLSSPQRRGRACLRARSLLACAGAVWIWPGVLLTEKRGASSVPVAADVARFWISRLHGPAADEPHALRCLADAADKLNAGDEAGAQRALDANGLTRLSPDGAALARALAVSLNIAPLDLPLADGPRLWTADVVAAHAALFKDHARAAGLLAKAGGWDESKHPRVPAGSPGGGQFQGGQGGGGSGVGVAERRSAASDDNGNGERPPQIPAADPLTAKLRNAFAKQAARWLTRAMVNGAIGPEGEYLTLLEAGAETASWLYDKLPYVRAYLDGPKSLEELQVDVGKPEKGYEVHHIVEQTPAAREGHAREDIDGPDNLVRIATLKHWEITGWYMTRNESYNFMSPRDYLRGKDWAERQRVGRDALIRFGVLKP